MSKEYKDLLVGLDINASEVVAVVAELRPDGAYEVIGMSQTESKGSKKGVVANIEVTVQSIQRALEEVELMADCKIGEVFTDIAGSHIRSLNSNGTVVIKDKEVTSTDVARVIKTAKAVNIPTGQQILYTLTQEFIIDGQEDVRELIGMSGIRLEVKVHIATDAISVVQNIVKCVRRCGLEAYDLILQSLALSPAVLTENEKELGVVLVDIGSGTTDIAIFSEGTIHHMAVIPTVGDQITNDIAMALHTPTPGAEDIKIQYNIVKQALVDPDEMVDVPGVGDRGPRMPSRQALAVVIEPCVEELFSLVHQVVREPGYEELLPSGMVLIGGTVMMSGMVKLGEDMFLKPVHMGVPEYRGNLHEVAESPRYTMVMGLLQEGRVQRVHGRKVVVQSGSAKQIWTRMKERFIDNFRARMCRVLKMCSPGGSKLSFLF